MPNIKFKSRGNFSVFRIILPVLLGLLILPACIPADDLTSGSENATRDSNATGDVADNIDENESSQSGISGGIENNAEEGIIIENINIAVDPSGSIHVGVDASTLNGTKSVKIDIPRGSSIIGAYVLNAGQQVEVRPNIYTSQYTSTVSFSIPGEFVDKENQLFIQYSNSRLALKEEEEWKFNFIASATADLTEVTLTFNFEPSVTIITQKEIKTTPKDRGYILYPASEMLNFTAIYEIRSIDTKPPVIDLISPGANEIIYFKNTTFVAFSYIPSDESDIEKCRLSLH